MFKRIMPAFFPLIFFFLFLDMGKSGMILWKRLKRNNQKRVLL